MSNNQMSVAEKNALSVTYEVLGMKVVLDLDFVKRYLVRGQPDKVTDQEILFFMNTCKMQKLNPLVSGEAYCIKFGNDPAQMVVGKGAYLRRAFEHPDYLCKEDGITVMRGDNVYQKEGCCLYPNETLIGGWCRVHFMRNGMERTAYKEVSLSEYDKGQANWKTKPATMVSKVAVSQCVREAFPKDYEGLYSEEEMIASGAIPEGAIEVTDYSINTEPDDNPIIAEQQRKALFDMAKKEFGKDTNEIVKSLIGEFGYENTQNMTTSDYKEILERLMELCRAHHEEMQDESQEPPED